MLGRLTSAPGDGPAAAIRAAAPSRPPRTPSILTFDATHRQVTTDPSEPVAVPSNGDRMVQPSQPSTHAGPNKEWCHLSGTKTPLSGGTGRRPVGPRRPATGRALHGPPASPVADCRPWCCPQGNSPQPPGCVCSSRRSPACIRSSSHALFLLPSASLAEGGGHDEGEGPLLAREPF